MGGTDLYRVSVELLVQVKGVAYLIAGLVLAILFCVGIHSIARRRWIRSSWLAWVPIANLWVLGSLSDQYQYLVRGKIKARRWGLILLAILTILLYLAGAYCVYLSVYKSPVEAAAFSLPMLLAFVLVVFLGAAVVTTVVQMYICCYNLFCSCDPDNRKLFLALSILFPAALPMILFGIRKQDGGMPPRKQPAPIVEEIIEEGEPENEQEEPVADA